MKIATKARACWPALRLFCKVYHRRQNVILRSFSTDRVSQEDGKVTSSSSLFLSSFLSLCSFSSSFNPSHLLLSSTSKSAKPLPPSLSNLRGSKCQLPILDSVTKFSSQLGPETSPESDEGSSPRNRSFDRLHMINLIAGSFLYYFSFSLLYLNGYNQRNQGNAMILLFISAQVTSWAV